MLTYQFRALSDENEDFLLDFEVPANMNLLDFASFIQQELGYDPSCITSIFTSDSEWEKMQEYTSVDMGIGADDMEYELCEDCDVPQMMEKYGLDDVVVEKFDRLLFVFDQVGERQLFIELLQPLKAEPGVSYPRVVVRQGEAPAQF